MRKKALRAPVGFFMGGVDSRTSGSTGARMLLLRAEGCLVCLALDVVEGVFAYPAEEGSRQASVDVVGWKDVSGMGSDQPPPERGSLVIVRTDAGSIGLRAEECLGVRDVSFLESPPIPTRLAEKEGRPLCYLLLVDRQPHFLIEPQALSRARENRLPARPIAPSGIAAIAPQGTAVGN
ncbi:MAG: hypothetical protein P8R42_03215 [Candidatus Binatia bacterium]|nr:hypothetical protein [Candidatus Binatia bacterium]